MYSLSVNRLIELRIFNGPLVPDFLRYLPRNMAQIRPFRAFRYRPDLNWEPYMFLSPLKDVVSDAQTDRLRSLPQNSVHMTQPRSAAEAVQQLKRLREKNILIQDALPAYYPYYQQFSLFDSPLTYVRKGLLVSAALNTPDRNNIIVHEGTVESSLNDRLFFAEQTGMQVIPVHGFYHDPDFTLEPFLDPYLEHPVLEFFDEQAVRNKFAVLHNRERLRFITDFLKEKNILLADGHHRLETAQRVFQRSGYHPSKGFILMYLTNGASNDLRILPTHRLVKFLPDFSEESFIDRLKNYFDLQPFNRRSPIYEELKGRSECFGLILPSANWILTLKKELNPVTEIPLPMPDSVKKLDYTVLHYFILDCAAGFPYAEQSNRTEISYVKDYTFALKSVKESGDSFAVIVNEVQMKDLIAVCADGAKMPQKSTYFFPKVISGFVFASVSDADPRSPFDIGF